MIGKQQLGSKRKGYAMMCSVSVPDHCSMCMSSVSLAQEKQGGDKMHVSWYLRFARNKASRVALQGFKFYPNALRRDVTDTQVVVTRLLSQTRMKSLIVYMSL